MTTQKAGGGAGVQRPAGVDGGADGAPVDSLLQSSLGRKLRDSYQEVVNEEVPEKFLALLDQLKKKEVGSGDDQP
ncbi:MAG: NepR family anti-sigma factor [Hyphomicrobiaceae bacterium]|nr:NepR family anti-sigma factor [Hyphomicrobiaceae bacterium]